MATQLFTKKTRRVILVSDADSDLSSINWSIYGNGYACSSKHGYIHRYIMARAIGRNLARNETVDHINHDPLDNRRENLRLASQSQNNANRMAQSNNKTGYKGVTRGKNGRYLARIGYQGKTIQVGSFDTPGEAAKAYDDKARELFGEFVLGSAVNDLPRNPRPVKKPEGSLRKSNRSGQRFISYNPDRDKWSVSVHYARRNVFIGLYSEMGHAIEARDKAVSEIKAGTFRPPENDRRFTRQQSGHRGVTYDASMGKWWARVTIAGKRVSVGYFDAVDEAVQAQTKARSCITS